MAVPKKKTSKSKQRMRSANWKLTPPVPVPCPQCRRPRLPHRACPECGYYAGREVIAKES